jgi:hypothetical protein
VGWAMNTRYQTSLNCLVLSDRGININRKKVVRISNPPAINNKIGKSTNENKYEQKDLSFMVILCIYASILSTGLYPSGVLISLHYL